MMTRKTPMIAGAALAATVALLSGGFASAAEIGDVAGTTAEEIKAALTADGYEVRKVEKEDGMLEAYAMKHNARFEIYVDPETGKVAKIEED